MILTVCFIVFMILWLFGGSYVAYSGEKFNPVMFGGHTILPWLCVAILGYLVLGGHSVEAPMPGHRF